MKSTFYSILSIIVVAACLFSCKSKKAKAPHFMPLTKYNMYDKKMVGKALVSARALKIDSTKSIKLLQQGSDLYITKNDTVAINVLKQSVYMFPQVNAYFKIGQVLTDMEASAKGEAKKAKLNEALQAYQIAEYLQYKPVAELYYNMACIDNLLADLESNTDNTAKLSFHASQAIFELRNAFENGFTDTAMLQKDVRLSSLLQTNAYNDLMAQLSAKKTADSIKQSFQNFTSIFPVLSQPYTISLKDLDQSGTNISTDFVNFIPGMETTNFGRGVNYDYYAIGKIAETPKYIALLYTSTEFDGDGPEVANFQPYTTILITYTPDGKIIDSSIVSCRCTMEDEKTVTFENNLITTQNFNITWLYSMDDLENIQEQIYDAEANLGKCYEQLGGVDKNDTTKRAKIYAKAISDSIDSNTVREDRLSNIQNRITKVDTLEKRYYKITDDGKISQVQNSAKVDMNKSSSAGNKGTK